MKLIKPLLFAVAISLAAPLAANAQCKGVKEEVDPFTKKAMKSFKQKIGPYTWNWQLILQKKNDDLHLGMQIVVSGKINDQLEKGDIIYIKLANDDVVELKCSEDYLPRYATSEGIIWTSYFPLELTDKKTMTKLSSSPITDVKVVLASTDILLPKISKKQTAKIMDGASCMLID